MRLFETINKSQKHRFFTLAGQHNVAKKYIKNIEIRIDLMSNHHEPYGFKGYFP